MLLRCSIYFIFTGQPYMGGEVVKICCVMELAGLKGREKLNGYAVDALITYEGK